MAKRRKKKSKIDGYKMAERGLGGFIYYGVELLIDIVIIFILIRGFSVSFKFSYDVFSDKAKNPATRKTVVVEIPKDSSATEISEVIYDAGVIENKYVMMAKLKIGGYGKDVKPGDEITIAFGKSEMKVRVLSTPDHVGKDDAPSLYEVLS